MMEVSIVKKKKGRKVLRDNSCVPQFMTVATHSALCTLLPTESTSSLPQVRKTKVSSTNLHPTPSPGSLSDVPCIPAGSEVAPINPMSYEKIIFLSRMPYPIKNSPSKIFHLGNGRWGKTQKSLVHSNSEVL